MSKLQITAFLISAIVLAIVGLMLFWTRHSARGVYRLVRLRLFKARKRLQATRSTNTVPAE